MEDAIYYERALIRHIKPVCIDITQSIRHICVWMDTKRMINPYYDVVFLHERPNVTVAVAHRQGPHGRFKKQFDWIQHHLKQAVKCEKVSDILVPLVGTISIDWLRVLKTFLV